MISSSLFFCSTALHPHKVISIVPILIFLLEQQTKSCRIIISSSLHLIPPLAPVSSGSAARQRHRNPNECFKYSSEGYSSPIHAGPLAQMIRSSGFSFSRWKPRQGFGEARRVTPRIDFTVAIQPEKQCNQTQPHHL